MSLKAKLEAVIYAAEEPVTLAQLAALFADEALEWQAERRAAASASEADSFPLLEAVAEETGEAVTEEPAAAEETASAPDENPETAEAAATDAGEPGTEGAPEAEPEAAAELSEADEKRMARQRDREVRAILRGLLDEIVADYAAEERGVEIREIAGGYRMATKPACHDAVRVFIKSLKPAMKLSLPALETLAVIAYKQPVTAPEINEIRGVESAGVLGGLLARKLIATAGRKAVIGRPILYKTTREFLLRFGLKDVNELPSMEEFEKMAASELDEPELDTQTVTTEAPANPVLEFDEAASEDEGWPSPETEAEVISPTAPQPPSAAKAETEESHGDQA